VEVCLHLRFNIVPVIVLSPDVVTEVISVAF
jgi:hypothetical protein